MIALYAGLMSLFVVGGAYAQTLATVQAWYDDERERQDQQAQEREKMDAAWRGAIDKGINITNWGVGTAVSARDLYDSWSALDSQEAHCGAAYNDASAPTVPSSCAEDDACEECYSQAVRSLDFNRFYIERARCIAAAHVKMANSAMAFGDSASGIHGVAGLSWQLQGKPQIEEAVRKLKGTYTKKAGEYLSGIERSLRKLGECEARHYGERDWFDRYGYLYLSFMKSKYASAPE